MKVIEVILLALTGIAFVLFISFVLSYPLMLLWNMCLVPAVTVLKEVGWLQMWGISVLISILFKPTISKSND
jgi:hypothetical protein